MFNVPSNQRDFFLSSGSVKLGEFQHLIEEWIPPATAWKGDNTGIQIGRPESRVTNILLALDATMEVAREAVVRKANLIVTHHPLLFQPLRSLTPLSREGEIALFLAERKISLYAAHTNLDHVRGGVSFAMAEILGLRNVRILVPMKGSFVKVVVYVPSGHLENVARAMHAAGAGKFAKYEECSFRSEGIGTFKGSEGAQPFIGTRGVLEKTPETKLEMITENWKLRKVLEAMVKTHPYEEVAYDLIPLQNENYEAGLGVIGECRKPMSQQQLLSLAKRAFDLPILRYSGRTDRKIRTVALCGGAGFEALEEAIRQGADAFITSDIKYHGFQKVNKDVLLIDAGHYETERHVLPLLASRIRSIAGTLHASSKVFITKNNTNSISYYQ